MLRPFTIQTFRKKDLAGQSLRGKRRLLMNRQVLPLFGVVGAGRVGVLHNSSADGPECRTALLLHRGAYRIEAPIA